MSMDQRRRRWLQFGIGTLLFVTLCVAGFLGGYQHGFQYGREAKSRTLPYNKAYYVADIIGALSSGSTTATSLTDYIEASISPGSWQMNGGPGALSYYENNKTIVVSNVQDVHDQIADMLQQIRLVQQQGKAKEVESILASVGT